MLHLQSIRHSIAAQSRKLLGLLRIRYVAAPQLTPEVNDNRPSFPSIGETAAEDCRNALAILQIAYVTAAGTIELTQPEFRAVTERLTRAVRKLEARILTPHESVRTALAIAAAADLERIHRPLLTRTDRTRKGDLEHQRRDAWARWLGASSLHSW